MWGKKTNFWSGNADAARRRRARSRRADEERVKTQHDTQSLVTTRPVKWEYHAPDDYKDVVYPSESEWGHYVYPQGITYYFDTQAERNIFKEQHIAKIRPLWEAKMARLEAEEAEWHARCEAYNTERVRVARERAVQIQLEEEAYDAETAQFSCLSRKLRNIQDWWSGTHTWRGVRR